MKVSGKQQLGWLPWLRTPTLKNSSTGAFCNLNECILKWYKNGGWRTVYNWQLARMFLILFFCYKKESFIKQCDVLLLGEQHLKVAHLTNKDSRYKVYLGSAFVTFSSAQWPEDNSGADYWEYMHKWHIHINEEKLVSLEAREPQFPIQQFFDSFTGMNLLFVCFLPGNTMSPSAQPQCLNTIFCTYKAYSDIT